MKQIKTIEFAHEVFVMPTGLTDRELVTFLGTLATLQRVNHEFTKDYEKHFSYVTGSATLKISNRTLCDTPEEAKQAREEYNDALDRKTELA